MAFVLEHQEGFPKHNSACTARVNGWHWLETYVVNLKMDHPGIVYELSRGEEGELTIGVWRCVICQGWNSLVWAIINDT